MAFNYRFYSKSFLLFFEKSALSVHVRDCSAVAVGDFDVAVLERAKNAVDVALLEARFVCSTRPPLNRCHEWCEV